MPTYEGVQREVKMTARFVPKSCARPPIRIDAKTRKYPSPLEKRGCDPSKPFASWKGEAFNLIGVLYDKHDCDQPRY